MKKYLFIFLALTPYTLFADSNPKYSLTNIPGMNTPGELGSISEYVNALFYIAVGLAALFAVIKFVIAGARYMMSDVVNSKEAAKSDMRGSIVGVLLIISIVIILNTINVDIMKTELALEQIQVDGGSRLGSDTSVEDVLISREDLPPYTGVAADEDNIFAGNVRDTDVTRAAEECANYNEDKCRPADQVTCFIGELRYDRNRLAYQCVVTDENRFKSPHTDEIAMTCEDGCEEARDNCESWGGVASEDKTNWTGRHRFIECSVVTGSADPEDDSDQHDWDFELETTEEEDLPGTPLGDIQNLE